MLRSRILVPERTIEAPPIPKLSGPRDAAARRSGSVLTLLRRYPGWSAGAALLAFSVVVVLVARTRPGYDPYGWLVWGKQTLHWNLDTNGAPSWKPLAYVFTVPYALVGHYQMWLWMFTSVTVSLSAVVFAARIAYRLTAAPADRRYAAVAAAVFAGLGVLGIRDYTHFILSAQSDTMIVALCLGAIDCHLSHRPRLAFALGVLGSLGRPEVWPFLGLYTVWAWRKVPSMRRLIVGGLLVLPVFWFGITAFTSKSPFTAGNLAFNSPRALHGNKIYGVIDRFLDLHEWPLQVAALLAFVHAAYRRERATVAIGLAAIVWVLVEIAFALHGWPAVPRYLFEPTAVVAVLAGIGVGRLLAVPARLPSAPQWARSARRWAGVVIPVALVGSLVPAAASRIRIEHKDLTHERARTTEINRLHSVISQLGGPARVLRCGQPQIPIQFQSILAWNLGVNVGILYYNPNPSKTVKKPVVLFEPHGVGWKVRTANATGSCAGLAAQTPLR